MNLKWKTGMKRTGMILLICLFYGRAIDAQPIDSLCFINTQLTSDRDEEMQLFLLKQFPQLQAQGISMALTFSRKAKMSGHYTYRLYYQQVPIYHSCIKVNTDKSHKVISVKLEHPDLDLLNGFDATAQQAAWHNVDIAALAKPHLPIGVMIKSHQFVIGFTEEQAQVMAEINTWNVQYDQTILIDRQGQLLEHYDNTRRLNIDSMVQCKIFNPDPLTTVNQVYGGIYKDLGDINSTWMDPAYDLMNVTATYNTTSGIFYLENQFVKMDDLEGPAIPAVSSLTPDFLFDRSQSGFEDVNVFYHISNYHQYLTSLGYHSLMNLQLLADAHAQNGADNSVFNRNGGSPTILFGIGGVDDGEDADVIIHEYAHGISWSANNNSTFSTERSALDEGLADYFATSYSRNLSTFHWDSLFTWDGHNEFWAGRTGSTTNMYPTIGSIYKTGEIWNSAMSAIWAAIGGLETDNLMLEALHFFTNQTTLPEAAMYILQADTILYGGVHSSAICNGFQSRQILNMNCKPASTNMIISPPGLQIANTLGFAQGVSSAVLSFEKPETGDYALYSGIGQCLHRKAFTLTGELRISPQGLPPGLYFLKVKTGSGQQVFRLCRL